MSPSLTKTTYFPTSLHLRSANSNVTSPPYFTHSHTSLLHFHSKSKPLNSTVAHSHFTFQTSNSQTCHHSSSMPPFSKRTRSEIQNLPPLMTIDDHQSKMSQYERSREERIRENRERMGKLGIFDISLSLKLKSTPPSRRTPSTPKLPLARDPYGPSRLSSRLQNVVPISYSEAPLKREVGEKNTRVVIREGSKPEVYTEEHEKLLGNTEKTWGC